MSDSLWPYGLQHDRLPCTSPSPGACLNSRPLSRWCHPTISSSAVPFPPSLQPFPASGSFPESCLFASGGQSISVSASASVLPENIQDWFPLGLTGLISLQPKRLSRIFSNTQFKSINSSALSLLYGPTLSQPYMISGKTIALTMCTLVGKVMSLLFNTLSRSVVAFLSRSKYLLISWLQSPSAVILDKETSGSNKWEG